MLNVFIVEDEPLIRDALRTMLAESAETLGINYCGEAGDGEIALSMMQEIKPDILITDIRMPFMDGLTLAKYAKELFPWLHVIIISGFQDFSYSQQAISIGVEGYLTKPIRKAELVEVIERIKAKRQKDTQSQNEPDRQEQIISFEYYKEHFLHKLKTNAYQPGEVYEREDRLNFSFVGKVYTTLAAKMIPLSKDKKFYHQLITRFSELFYEDKQVLLKTFDNFFITGIISGTTEQDSLNKAYYVADMIKYELNKLNITDMVICIGPGTNRITELAKLLQYTEDATKDQAYSATQQIIEKNPLLLTADEQVFNHSNIAELLRAKEMNIPLIQATFTQFLAQVAEPDLIRLKLLESLLEQIQLLDEKTFTKLTTEYSVEQLGLISKTPSLFNLTSQIFLEELQQVKRTSATTELPQSNRLIKRCIAYLEENYSDPNISLQSLAEYLSISPAYLSTIFSQHEGINFIEYLTQIRMKAAEKLLTETNKKIIDITFDVGYNDPNYFSFIFKKRHGLTPKEYRKQA